MSNEKLITLPDRETMMELLRAVVDEPHLQERFYPLLVKAAGEEKLPIGVVMLLTLAIHDYVEGMPPIIANTLFMRAEQFIDALIEDKAAAAEAKGFLKQSLQR